VSLRFTEKSLCYTVHFVPLWFYLNLALMPTIKFTYALKRFFPKLKDTPAAGNTLAEIFKEIETNYPGLQSYVLDERGSLRRHVNIFIDGKMINDRSKLTDAFTSNSEIYIMQALSGG